MPQDRQTLYEILGVARNAKLTDIGRAYGRVRAEMQQETAAPDPRRLVRVQNAYEVLSDEARREAYDQSLRAPLARGANRRRTIAVSIAAAAVVLAAIGWFAWRREGKPPERPVQEIAAAAALAVGRVQSIDMAGHATALGLVFAVNEGTLAASCRGLTPSSELVVQFAQRSVHARVAASDDGRGYCVLEAPGTGSWPLSTGGPTSRAGDKVYAATVSATGDVALLEGTVRRVAKDAGATLLEISAPAASQAAGGPLLDSQGRVVAIAEGNGRHRVLSR